MRTELRPMAGVLAILLVFGAGTEALNQSMQVVIDDQDWQNVYAGTVYAVWNDARVTFMTNSEQPDALAPLLNKEPDVLLISGEPGFSTGQYEKKIQDNGIRVQDVIRTSKQAPAFLVLAERVKPKRFVVMDGTFGYNAVGALTYVLAQNAWPVFAERISPQALGDFLAGYQPELVVAYGPLGAQTKAVLEAYKPLVIDKGNRFLNNIALNQEIIKSKVPGQFLLTNGEFLEISMFQVRDPILLIGKQSAPKPVVDFLRQTPVVYGVLIGSELAQVARELKENTPMKYIFVKFAQAQITATERVAGTSSLNTMALPEVPLNITIDDARFNDQQNEMEVTYTNREGTATYVSGEVAAFLNETLAGGASDAEPFVLAGGESRTVVYKVALSDRNLNEDRTLNARVQAFYGEDSGALERHVEARFEGLAVVSYQDQSSMELQALEYASEKQGFEVTVSNNGSTAAYAVSSLVFELDGKRQSARTTRANKVSEGQMVSLFVHFPMDSEQVAQMNAAPILTIVHYGEREGYLTKTLEQTRLFRVRRAVDAVAGLDWTILAVIGVLLIGALAFLTRQKDNRTSFRVRRRWR